jgi:hypothetical protein
MKKDLKFFIVQFKVKKLYRDYMKVIYKSKNPELRSEMVQLVRGEFLMNKDCENLDKIDYYLAVGRQKIGYLKSMIDMQC